MDSHSVIEVLLGLVAFFGGMFVKGLNDSVKSLHIQDAALTEKIHDIENVVAGDYVKREDFDRKIDKLFIKLDLIAERLDSKADKTECKDCKSRGQQ